MEENHTLQLLQTAIRKFTDDPQSRGISARLIALYAIMLCQDELSPEAAEQAARLAAHLRKARFSDD